jgi:hypothetical protein
MAWRTLYVAGREGFNHVLTEGLHESGEDYLTGSFNSDGTYLFWVTDTFDLDNLKSTIGSRKLFKFRIRFFTDIDMFKWFMTRSARSHRFTAAQEQMFRDLD